MPPLPAACGVAGGGRARQARRVRLRGVLGAAAARLRGPVARVLVLGLAPAAHGGNRTGRIFTGDRSGDWLFAALWRAGFANQPESVYRSDGLMLTDCFVTAAVRCAPPANRPTPAERDTCLPYFARELELLPSLRVVVCLGGFAWDAALRVLGPAPRPRPKFAHGAEAAARPPDAHRLLPRQPAEHVHRTPDRADARRDLRPRQGGCQWWLSRDGRP